VEEEEGLGAVNVANFCKEESSGIGNSAIGAGIVKMAVSKSPLGTGCGLEVVAPELNEALGLVTIPWVTETT
jgi:hypothetical protein